MRESAFFVNTSRGQLIDEDALYEALKDRRIAGAGLDVFEQEPLPREHPLWTMPGVLITPHTAGETRRYEDNVLDTLLDNLQRLWRGEAMLRNQIV